MKRLVSLAGVAALVCGGLLAITTLASSHQVGTPVSDSVAASIHGGCSGVDGFMCNAKGCAGEFRICESTNNAGTKPAGEYSWCNGVAGCGGGVKGILPCGT